jgi:hypothetical protein
MLAAACFNAALLSVCIVRKLAVHKLWCNASRCCFQVFADVLPLTAVVSPVAITTAADPCLVVTPASATALYVTQIACCATSVCSYTAANALLV